MRRSIDTHLAIIRRHYPIADTAENVFSQFISLAHGCFGLSSDQILIADSVCCDDINTIEYPYAAQQMLGPFKMGGLNGFPFGGLTACGAAAAHVPSGGAFFLFYAPHIGITHKGELGYILRHGQDKITTCCGAAQAGLSKLKTGTIAKELTTLDYQQGILERILLQNKARIEAADSAIKEATEVMYEAIERRIDRLINNTQFSCPHVFVMGSIMINGDRGVGAHLDVRRFLHINIDTGTVDDLEQELNIGK